MTTKKEMASDADPRGVFPQILGSAPEGLRALQHAAALLYGIKALADKLVDKSFDDANMDAWALRELADMAAPQVDRATCDFSDVIVELQRVAPMLPAQAGTEGAHHV